ncbi:MAG: hypothetical protein J6D29_08630 [Solobacterium sp.]|nr:hypothetical protein [Solobacterium sp.]
MKQDETKQLKEQIEQLMIENHLLLDANEKAIKQINEKDWELKNLKNKLDETNLALKTVCAQNERARKSWNWRVGSFFLWLPKKIYYLFKREK